MVDGHGPVADDGADEADHASVCCEHCGALFDEVVGAPMTAVAADRGKTRIDRSRERRFQTDATGMDQHGDDEHDGQGDPFLPVAAATPYRQRGAVGRGSVGASRRPTPRHRAWR